MNLYHTKILAGVVLMVALCLVTPPAQAHSVHARELEATIQIIRAETGTLVLIPAKTTSPREMVWNKSTSFVEGDHLVDAGKLLVGIQVKVYYHSPFFGRPYLTKVVWNKTASQTK